MADSRITNRLDKYDEDFLKCRMRRHRWPDEPQTYYFTDPDTHERWVVCRYVCESCDMVREDFFTAVGEFYGRQYIPPSGYGFTYTEEERAQGVRVTTRDAAALYVQRAVRRGAIASSFDDLDS